MRKTFSIILAVIIFCSSAIFADAANYTVNQTADAVAGNSEGDFYTKDNSDGTITITGYKGTSPDVLIPSYVFGSKVTRLTGLNDGKSFITSVTIPEGVKLIGDSVFSGFSKLKSVYIPSSVKKIGNQAFYDTPSLETVNLPANCSQGTTMFSNSGIKSIVIPEGWETITEWCFNDCTDLAEVSLPSSLKEISYEAFHNCKSLKKIKLPNKLEAIHTAAFSFSGLTEIEIPDSVKKIDGSWFDCGVFEGCENLTKVRFSNSMEKIPERIFDGCKKLKSFVVPYLVKKIGEEAFEDCTNLENTIISGNVTNIGDNSFNNCPNLVIYSIKDSYVDKYANNKNIPFVPLIGTTGIALNTSGVAINKGETYQLYATNNPKATVTDIYWKSSDYHVATVSSDGLVTSVDSGVAEITAITYDGKTAKCTITVYGDITGISLNKTSLDLNKGKTYTLKATILPKYAKNKTLSWKTSNKKIVTVKNGKVKAVGKGKTKITVTTCNGKKATCKVTVKVPAKKIKLSKKKLTLKRWKKFKLKAKLNPKKSTDKVTWSTSNSYVATVVGGVISSRYSGKAVITATTSSGKKAKCIVKVIN